MGGVAGAETTKKALRLRATASDGDGASVHPPEPQQQPAPLPAAGVAGNAADGSAAVHQSCGEDDDQDDEQVERFYALLANIRALRGLYSAGTGPAASGRGKGRKRAREAEVPWTPAFRLEDFEEEVKQGAAATDARSTVMNQGASGIVARRPAAAARARAAVAAADDGHDEDEVARGGNKLGLRVAARG
ncbi:NRR repressor homolog 1-like [Miscanthus floridulus]|uniref:NRR repressor homolog 1-like n=1 Tax=Miscanthus floridulus TaxID=154761 RepID=UPI0034599526